MKRLFLFCIALVMLSAVVAFAHSGGTDYKGGHYVNGTSEYHYHHGYKAHQHPGGECPYDFKDKSSSSGGSSSVSSSSVSVAPSSPKRRLTTEEICWIVFGSVYFLVGFGLFIYHIKAEKDFGCLFSLLFYPPFLVASSLSLMLMPIIERIAEKRRQRKLLASSRTPKRTTPPMPVKKARNFEEESFEALANMSDDELNRYFYTNKHDRRK